MGRLLILTGYTYDVLNRLTSVKDALGQITGYQYDRNGQMTETTMRSSENSPTITLKNKRYNELGLMYDKKDASSQSENQVYNPLGLLQQKTDRNGTTSSYQYDERDQVVSSLLTGSGGNTQQTKVIFGSSGIKNDTNELYRNGSKVSWQTVTIDNLKRLNTVASQATGYSASTSYTYDLANRTTRIGGSHTGVGVSYTNYQYNKQRLEKVQLDGSSTVNNAASANAVYGYNALGLVQSITYPTLTDGSILKTEYTYDALKQVSTLKNKKGSNILSSYSYQYDNNGNITHVTEVVNDGPEKTTKYDYDKLNRLLNITRPDGGITSYTYDLQGNRTLESDTSTGVLNDTMSISYTYDLQNTLTGVTKDTSSTSFSYLPEGLRYQKTTDGVSTQYNYDSNGNVISELKSNGQKANYIRGDRLLVKKDVASAKDYYYLYNGHGDVVQIVDKNGAIINSYAYDVWGNITSQTEGISNSFKYAGEIYDAETGLYYLRARYYDPSIGRFLNEDTVEGQIDNPLTLNLYTYVHNNPLIYVDPTGKWCESKDGKYSHPGACSNPKSGTYSADVKHNGEVMKSNGKSTGIYKFDYGDGVHEDNSWTGMVFDTVVTAGAGLGRSVLKMAASTLAKQAAEEVTYTLSKNAVGHIEKHMASYFQKQVKYLTKEQLDNKLKNNSFFNPAWSEEKIISVVEKGYSIARNQGITGLYEHKVGNEIIKIFIKEDGMFDTAYGMYKLTSSYFGK